MGNRNMLARQLTALCVSLVAAVALAACGGDDDSGGGGGNNTTPDCTEVTCEPLADYCDGDTLYAYTDAGQCVEATGECDYSAVLETTDCTDDGHVCRDGACVPTGDQCDGVSCDTPPAASCDGNLAVTYAASGTCDPADGTCSYEETTVDCTESNQVCSDGACVDAGDLCAGVTCDQPPADACDGDTVVSYDLPGTCDATDGSCDYTETRTDCTESSQVCSDGACVDPSDPCAGVTCDSPPADACDGDTVVSYDLPGTCTAVGDAAECSYTETRNDCTQSDQVCDSGACVDPSGVCSGVTCDSPPADTCNGDTAVTYDATGTCFDDNGTAACDYNETQTDCATTNQVCDQGACVDPVSDPTPAAGDLVVTEVMQNPSAVGDTSGEYFEVYNATGRTLELNGVVVSDAGADTFTVTDPSSNPIEIAAGAYFIFGVNGDTATNGGVTVDYVYSGFTLSNGDDEIILTNGAGVEIDRVEYDGGTNWPDPTGASMQFGSEYDLAADDNNLGSNWCTSGQQISGGSDFGTPGAANTQCTLPTAAVSIYELQDESDANHPTVGQPVAVSAVVVTAIEGDATAGIDAIWVGESSGGAYSGAFVDTTSVTLPTGLAVGDAVDVEGTYTEAYNVTTIEATAVTAASASVTPPAAEAIQSSVLADPLTAEPYEGVLVTVAEPAVTDEEPDGSDYGEFRIDNAVRVDDQLYDYDTNVADPTNCDYFDALAGVLHYTFGNYKILPRDAADFGTPTTLTVAATNDVSIASTATGYTPAAICLATGGGTVTWTNADSAAHTVTERDPITDASAASPLFDLNITAGASDSYDFTTAGTYPYLCTIHPSMMGRVIVLE